MGFGFGVIAVGMWVACAIRVRRWPGSNPTARAFTRCLFALAACCTLLVRSISSQLDAAVGVIGLSDAALHCFAAFGLTELIIALRFMEQGPDNNNAVVRTWRGYAVVTQLLLLSTVILGGPASDDVASVWMSWQWWLAYWIPWLTFCAITWSRIITYTTRFALRAGPSRLRTTMALLAVGAFFGIMYVVTTVGQLAAHWVSSPARYTWWQWAVWTSLVLMLLALGFSSVWAATGGIPWVRCRQDWKSFRRIRPLWSRLQVLDPQLALVDAPSHRPATASETEMALYRACVEIRDWMKMLRINVPADTWDRACVLVHDRGYRGLGAAALATAAWMEAALAARERGVELPTPSPSPTPRRDVDAEMQFIVRVALAPTAVVHDLVQQLVSDGCRSSSAEAQR